MNARLLNHLKLTKEAAAPQTEEEDGAPPAEECTPPEVLNPDTNECETPEPSQADEGAAAPQTEEEDGAPPEGGAEQQQQQ